jgi:hypothetical protein
VVGAPLQRTLEDRRRSGYGKALANPGLEEFVNKKLILVPKAAA